MIVAVVGAIVGSLYTSARVMLSNVSCVFVLQNQNNTTVSDDEDGDGPSEGSYASGEEDGGFVQDTDPGPSFGKSLYRD